MGEAMKPKKNTDDQTTVSMKADEVSTVVMGGARGKKAASPTPANEDLKLIHSYWRSGSPALKRQAVSRYAQLMNVSPQRAEEALGEWSAMLDQSKK
jgi:hypothetical protein